MDKKQLKNDEQRALVDAIAKKFNRMMVLLSLLVAFIVFMIMYTTSGWQFLDPVEVAEEQFDSTAVNDTLVVDGIHMASGLIADEGYEVVKVQCGACHSLKLVTQNRATRDGWEEIIRWMQATQKLWDLGSNEDVILDYLAKNYAPQQKSRREPLKNVEWYPLEE